nr:importin-5-like isoform X1 [Tanacetum cinerariifolium]
MSGNYVKTTYLLAYFDRDILGRMLDGFRRSAFEIVELIKAASHWAKNENDDAWESRNYNILLESLHRLAVKLYDNTVVWLVLEQYLATSKWQKRGAAIVAFA